MVEKKEPSKKNTNPKPPQSPEQTKNPYILGGAGNSLMGMVWKKKFSDARKVEFIVAFVEAKRTTNQKMALRHV